MTKNQSTPYDYEWSVANFILKLVSAGFAIAIVYVVYLFNPTVSDFINSLK
jgi:hypothetical protein